MIASSNFYEYLKQNRIIRSQTWL